jgi:glycerophosphoryl diester phosphodiesterase
MDDAAVPADPSWPPSPLIDVISRVRPPPLPVVVIGHRGDSQNAPENTLAAFRLALDRDADMVEFDVHETADGDVVVIHDDKVDRTTEGHGEVHRLRTDELRELSAGAWFASRYTDERVPLLDEVLDMCRGRAVPLIEVKVKRRRAPKIGLKIVEALVRHGMQEEAVVICKEKDRVREIHDASPTTPLAYLTFTKRQARGAARLRGVRGIDCYWKSLSLSLIAELRAASVFLTPWTVNRPRDMDRLLLLGCESIITDSPVLLRDRIEGFEFARTQDLLERFRSGNVDLDLELEEDDDEDEDASPQQLSDDLATASEVDLPGLDELEGL